MPTKNEVSGKPILAANLPFVILIIILFGYLTVRALPENHIDLDSAQALLAARYWARDGFTKHYFLQLPSGYGKIVRYFDEPELQQHAGGTITGSLIGNKIYYTRYPSFYIIPTALIMKLGIKSLFLLRLLPIVVSILSLIFLYIFIKLITNKVIAFIAALYFGISPIFITSADSLYYYPFEDMWRFLILMLSILAIKKFKYHSKPDLRETKIIWYLLFIWIAYFLMALTSFDSTFFIFIWLSGLSLYYFYNLNNLSKSHKIKLFLFFIALWSSAPIFAFAIQQIQNAAYLGWHNVWPNIYGAFVAAGNNSKLDFYFRSESLIRPFFSMIGLLNFYTLIAPLGIAKLKQGFIASSIPTAAILPIFIFLAMFSIIKLKKITAVAMPKKSILTLLTVAPLVQTFILPFTGFRDYMGRLTAPFIGIIIGIMVWMLFLAFTKNNSLTVLNKMLFLILAIFITMLFAIQVILNIEPRLYSAYAPLPDNEITFSKSMQNIVAGEKAVFMINTADTQVSTKELEKRYSSLISPRNYFISHYMIWEYYFDMPLLNFTRTSYLIKDLLFLEKRTDYPFTAIVTSDNLVLITEVYKNLKIKQFSLSKMEKMNNRYFFTVGPK